MTGWTNYSKYLSDAIADRENSWNKAMPKVVMPTWVAMTICSGKMFDEEVEPIYKALSEALGRTVFTHEMTKAMDMVAPVLLESYPMLSRVSVEGDGLYEVERQEFEKSLGEELEFEIDLTHISPSNP